MSRLTPMQEHQMRVAAAATGSQAALDQQQRAMQWLYTQRAYLGGIKSRQAREAHKAQALPEVLPYLQGVLSADSGQPDPVVAYASVWAIDGGLWDLALELGHYTVRHGLPMPDEFERNAATVLADLMADAALCGRMPSDIAPAAMQRAIDITQDADMPDQTRAKAHKAIAYGLAGKTTLAGQPGEWSALDTATLQMVLHHLLTAERFDPQAGVKKDIAAVQKLLDKQPTQEPQAGEEKTPAATKRRTRASAKTS